MTPVPFALFGPSHIVALVLPFVLPPLLAWTVQPRIRPQLDRVLRWTLGAAMTVNWFGWMLMLHGKGWLGVDNEFPLNLCDWATVATVATLFWPNQRTYELAYFWALAGTLQGMLTPDVQLDFPDIQFLLFFVFHGGIIAGVLYLTFGLRLRPYLRSLPRVVAWSFVYMGTAGLFDWLAGANYGLLRVKPPYPTVLDAMPPWPYYLGVLVLLALASIAIYYAPFFVMDQIVRRRAHRAISPGLSRMTVTDNTASSRFELQESGLTAFANYRRSGAQVIIPHVEAPPALRGTGTAGRLMDGIVARARTERFKIIPTCSYARAWFRRHKDAADVLA